MFEQDKVYPLVDIIRNRKDQNAPYMDKEIIFIAICLLVCVDILHKMGITLGNNV